MDFYPWVKALHVISIIAWMAGMLYLPRLFVYHCEAEPGSKQSETFKLMERRLMNVIINPAMTLAWALGLWLAWTGGFFTSGWFHAKLLLVVALSALHGLLSRCVRDFAADRNRRTQKFYRIINEIPAVLMVGIGNGPIGVYDSTVPAGPVDAVQAPVKSGQISLWSRSASHGMVIERA